MIKRAGVLLVIATAAAAAVAALCWRGDTPPGTEPPRPRTADRATLRLIEHPRTSADRIVNGAKQEAIRGVVYDASYARLRYPGGDVSSDRGACTDVVIRALRAAGRDLQKLIHEDVMRSPGSYRGGRADSNIDHRRVPNQIAFMRRHGKELTVATTEVALKTWQPGDIVYWKFDNGLDHCGIISNEKSATGVPLVIHNCCVAAQEDCLTAWRIVGHFRYPKSR